MLILSRRTSESIIIGENIIVMVVQIRGDKVRLGIEAPREVSVNRLEVHEAIKRSKGSTEVRQEDASSSEKPTATSSLPIK